MTDVSATPSIEVGNDLVRRGLLLLPVLVLVAGLLRGVDGAVSAALAVAVVLLNFAIAAYSLAWAARVSPNAVAATALGTYIVRIGIVVAAFVVCRNLAWFDKWVFGITLIATHLGLLVWETRYVGLTLGAPGLRPGPLPKE